MVVKAIRTLFAMVDRLPVIASLFSIDKNATERKSINMKPENNREKSERM